MMPSREKADCQLTTTKRIADEYLEKRSLIETLYTLGADITQVLSPPTAKYLQNLPQEKRDLYLRLTKQRYQ